MKETPTGTPVGVDDPYAHAGHCDHVTDQGACRFAFDHYERDPVFAQARREDDYQCPVARDDWEWRDCPHYRSRSTATECARCGLPERRTPAPEDRPLLEHHHLSYPDQPASHEITVVLCRWCHAKVHRSWARITDDVNPSPEAIAAHEGRRTRELDELAFPSAADRQSDTT